MSTDLRDLLELASDDVAEVDLAQWAWDRAREERRAVRRRVVLGAAAAAAAGAAVTLVVRDRGDDGSVPAEPVRTDPATLPTAVVGGVTVDLAPDPEKEPELPRYVDAEALALGRRIGFDDAGPLPKLGPGTGNTSNAASVRAVLLAWAPGAETIVPVLHTPRGGAGREYLVCTDVQLVRADPTQTGQGMVLDSRTIRDDRRAVVFPQPGGVVLLDARTGTAERIRVPDQGIHRAGWAKDGTTVVARGAEGSWLVDTARGTVTRATGPVGPGWVDLVTTDDGVTSLRTFAGSGHLTGSRPLRGPLVDVSDETVGNTEGWASAHTYLGQVYGGAIARSQGLLAVQGDLRPTPRILAATSTPSVPKDAYRPLTWGPRDVVVLESRSFLGLSQSPALHLLAWDVIGGGLSLVGEVGPVRPVGYGFTGAYAL